MYKRFQQLNIFGIHKIDEIIIDVDERLKTMMFGMSEWANRLCCDENEIEYTKLSAVVQFLLQHTMAVITVDIDNNLFMKCREMAHVDDQFHANVLLLLTL